MVKTVDGNGSGDYLGTRPATRDDLETMLSIYNHAVANTTASFELVPRSLEAQEAWLEEHAAPYASIVWEDDNGKILGWGSIGRYAERAAYRFSGEVSVYVDPDSKRQGVGETILRGLIELGGSGGFHTLIALITEENTASLRLAEKTGFERTGTLEEVGFKFDRWLDVAIYQRSC